MNQDTFFSNTLKGVGLRSGHRRRLLVLGVRHDLTSKMPMTACDIVYDRVLPFYEALGVPIAAVLTDNGREFCGRPETHPYELLLGMEGIEHRTTRVHTPRTNGFVERINRTLLDACFRVAGRTTWYLEPADTQHGLDVFLEHYNLRRSHQGYRLGGRTPAQALREALAVEGELPSLASGFIVPEGEEVPATVAA